MKVYVVVATELYDQGEVLEVVGVFADKDEAEKLAASGSHYYIQESKLQS